MRKNNAFVAKIVNMHFTKIFMAIFAPDERLPRSATLVYPVCLAALCLVIPLVLKMQLEYS